MPFILILPLFIDVDMYDNQDDIERIEEEVKILREALTIREQMSELGHTSYIQAQDEMFRRRNPEYVHIMELETEDIQKRIKRLERDYQDLVEGEFRTNEKE